MEACPEVQRLSNLATCKCERGSCLTDSKIMCGFPDAETKTSLELLGLGLPSWKSKLKEEMGAKELCWICRHAADQSEARSGPPDGRSGAKKVQHMTLTAEILLGLLS